MITKRASRILTLGLSFAFAGAVAGAAGSGQDETKKMPPKKSPANAESASPSALPTIKFEKYTLPNGLVVILSEDHRLPLVATNIWYHVGPANELPGRTGFAHLFEHMMFE